MTVKETGVNEKLQDFVYPTTFLARIALFVVIVCSLGLGPTGIPSCAKDTFANSLLIVFQLDRTALQWAAANGHWEVINVLLGARAEIEAFDKVSTFSHTYSKTFKQKIGYLNRK